MDRTAVRAAALAHGIFPCVLSQELVRWSDVVVDDGTYYFDSSAMLYTLTMANQWRVGLLVDEAHNMLERARGMYTADLSLAAMALAWRAAPAKAAQAAGCAAAPSREMLGSRPGNRADERIPPPLLAQLQQTAAACSAYFAEQGGKRWSRCCACGSISLAFSRLAESFGDHSLFDITRDDGAAGARAQGTCIRNVVLVIFRRAAHRPRTAPCCFPRPR